MSELHDHELSGLLDGELDTSGAETVRLRIAADPTLREEFEALTRLDARLRKTAEGAAFSPHVPFPSGSINDASNWNWVTGAVGVAGLLIIRFVPKAVETTAYGFALSLAALVVISAVVARMVREMEPAAESLALSD